MGRICAKSYVLQHKKVAKKFGEEVKSTYLCTRKNGGARRQKAGEIY